MAASESSRAALVRSPTMGDVAAGAGVSRATVSRALSRPERLRPETVERVKQTAQELGYVLNPVAKALSTGRFGNLALVVPDIANPFFPPMIRAMEGLADRAGFSVFLGNADEDPAREHKLLGQLAKQVDGIVLASSRMTEELIREHAERRPLVLVNRDVAGLPRVLVDSAGGVAQAVEHLAGLGHRHIAYLNGPSRSWSNTQRRRTVQRTAERLGRSVSMVAARLSSYEAGRRAVPALLACGASAVIAFDDLLAHGVLTGLAERGVAVPSAFSVVGCDDVLAAQTHPQLTTVSARAAEAGRAAVELLTGRLASAVAISDARLMLETSLVVRATTGPAPGR
ncbi:LacI family DNA-binding transcriptional regulator [Streptacidiphilus sp. N1-12]|uniref:LacI family DNA-binding transcriptional regulator n=2 Tax=Streptacidiphilus alkalitolerans TaxID=3342712 RepID=A0ABV6VCX1_9ACTN